ncbi:hypothetical protein SAY87_028223 [Trapa incisa]|uniref:SMP domain-containing protein n=1 Tax=Trapa incisa TaxID=236973 RepID=A0AAN7KXG0_9MYRT|nr:hypothetical protein SAY87_028223 [Trapa incisa]
MIPDRPTATSRSLKLHKGGAASIMQSAATHNERAGLVGHREVTGVTGEGVNITELHVPGSRIIIESISGQYMKPAQLQREEPAVTAAERSTITIGEALEAAALSMSHKPVDQGEVAAIQAAEVRSTGSTEIIHGGLAASAQSAAAHNEQVVREEDKIKLSDILTVWPT